MHDLPQYLGKVIQYAEDRALTIARLYQVEHCWMNEETPEFCAEFIQALGMPVER